MTKELSPLAKQLLGNAGHIELFTQTEFDEALALAKAEIMQVAIETTKKAIFIEREACAEIAKKMAADWANDPEALMSLPIALQECAEKILNRIPSQKQ